MSAFITLTAILVTMTTRDALAQTMQLDYSINEERPAMTRLGSVLHDSSILDFVDPRDVHDLRFSFLSEGDRDASHLWINSTSGELKTRNK